MNRYIIQFRDILDERGIFAALSATFFFFERKIEEKFGIDDYIMDRFAIGGPSSILHALYVGLYTPILNLKIGTGIDIIEEDWDTLIFLDSYRADYFQEYSSLDGDFSTVVSKANVSAEFVEKNFQDDYHDTVVVTANPWYELRPSVDDSTFHALISPIGADGDYKANPKRVTEAAINAHERFPNKRIIVHYMQPHTPHMGGTAERLRREHGADYPGVFTLFRRGLISQDTLKQSYIETIEVAENEVQRVLANVDGKTVVSSDHGENLGELQHGMMQLRHGNPTPECRYVPWLEVECDERREIVEGTPIGFETPDDTVIEERLAALGYK